MILALISGEALLHLLLLIVVWGVILWILWWGLNTINPPEPWKKVCVVILVLITVVVLVNALLGIAGGKQFISW